uniref:Alpha-carbonic anhydrase domain-containing protein n=1 Tax=Gasterosteus aculeatus aculeatus TaxID=481459 RepID=A0AAQ4QVS2_GASAC
MVTLCSAARPLASLLRRHVLRRAWSSRIVPARRCNLLACSSKYVLSQIHPMWQEPLTIPGGDRQSPIDIAVRKSVFDSELKPLVYDYDPQTCQQIWNNGYSFLVEYDDTTDKSTLKGGPLQDTFRLCQFHFHWGESNAWGSEHTVDRRLFPAEKRTYEKLWHHSHAEGDLPDRPDERYMPACIVLGEIMTSVQLHLVHWNADRYSLFEEAVMEDNGLAVIGVFLKVGKRHEGVQKLVDALPAIRHKDSVVEFTRFDPACLLPANTDDYWTYHGSLTTPPLTESVSWMVMKQHIEVSHDQLAVFRSLLFTSAEEDVQRSMVNNFRVQQSLCSRTVRSSFSPFLQEADADQHAH